ncbi:hypothetical protein IHE45_20G049100 [Dioscorea alata]|uniref:Uncharacterized protein n=3 Tax=Dioscorea alata TaxID=55571 RepID=A0ACB7TQL6_DIOAL|nr:hypothetical protein IHE45_20G049100 [Dioscorea alata]KAH7651320.1 hypothetical protein IHE45_20G049100 [Dioscorea alata]KAH7651321.1 hypothetical protein IHE45_20G049100 [Dioscorea alata]
MNNISGLLAWVTVEWTQPFQCLNLSDERFMKGLIMNATKESCRRAAALRGTAVSQSSWLLSTKSLAINCETWLQKQKLVIRGNYSVNSLERSLLLYEIIQPTLHKEARLIVYDENA